MLPIYVAKDKTPYYFTNIWSLGSIEYIIFYFTHHLIAKVMFILFTISVGLEFIGLNYDQLSHTLT